MMSQELQQALIKDERARIRQLSALIELLAEKGVLTDDQVKVLDKLKPPESLDEYVKI